MNYIQPFTTLTPRDRPLTGGKAASLGILVKHGFRVPKGFVITTIAFDTFLEFNDLRASWKKLASALAKENWQEATTIAATLEQNMQLAQFPKDVALAIYQAYQGLENGLVAIRSSAVEEDSKQAAWAGILATFLNTPKQDLLSNIKACWASLFSKMAIQYLNLKGNTAPNLSMAVIVQEMVSSEMAGVAFSMNPVNQQANQLIIEAVKGLGESLVAGAIIPDNYVVDKANFDKVESQLGNNGKAVFSEKEKKQLPLLSMKQITKLAQQTVAIETLYKCPVDIEWAWSKEQLYILQSRPITTPIIPIKEDLEIKLPINKAAYQFMWADHLAYWGTDAGLCSYAKHRDIVWNQIEEAIVFTQKGKSFAYFSQKDIAQAKIRGAKLLAADCPETLNAIVEVCKKAHDNLYQALKKCSFEKLTNEELKQFLLRIEKIYSRTIGYYKASGPYASEQLMDALLAHFSAENLHVLSLPTHLDEVSKEELDWMKVLAQPLSERAILEHIEKYPWVVLSHFTYESMVETLTQRYEVDKSNPLNKVISLEKKELKAKQKIILNKHLKQSSLIANLQALSDFRMELKTCLAGIDYHLIPFFRELASRFQETVYDLNQHYRIVDLIDLLTAGQTLSNEAKEQRTQGMLGVWQENKLQYYFGAAAAKKYQQMVGDLFYNTAITGVVANRGNQSKIKGIARILECNNVQQAKELRKHFQKGDILVTSMVQFNSWEFMSKAAAVITDEGGILSHAAILARERNIPCIVGTHTATAQIEDGQEIIIDTLDGSIRWKME